MDEAEAEAEAEKKGASGARPPEEAEETPGGKDWERSDCDRRCA